MLFGQDPTEPCRFADVSNIHRKSSGSLDGTLVRTQGSYRLTVVFTFVEDILSHLPKIRWIFTLSQCLTSTLPYQCIYYLPLADGFHVGCDSSALFNQRNSFCSKSI